MTSNTSSRPHSILHGIRIIVRHEANRTPHEQRTRGREGPPSSMVKFCMSIDDKGTLRVRQNSPAKIIDPSHQLSTVSIATKSINFIACMSTAVNVVRSIQTRSSNVCHHGQRRHNRRKGQRQDVVRAAVLHVYISRLTPLKSHEMSNSLTQLWM